MKLDKTVKALCKDNTSLQCNFIQTKKVFDSSWGKNWLSLMNSSNKWKTKRNQNQDSKTKTISQDQ